MLIYPITFVFLQEYPSGMENNQKDMENPWQVWHETGKTCPAGTIPVRRDSRSSDAKAVRNSHPKAYPTNPTHGHQVRIYYLV